MNRLIALLVLTQFYRTDTVRVPPERIGYNCWRVTTAAWRQTCCWPNQGDVMLVPQEMTCAGESYEARQADWPKGEGLVVFPPTLECYRPPGVPGITFVGEVEKSPWRHAEGDAGVWGPCK